MLEVYGDAFDEDCFLCPHHGHRAEGESLVLIEMVVIDVAESVYTYNTQSSISGIMSAYHHRFIILLAVAQLQPFGLCN